MARLVCCVLLLLSLSAITFSQQAAKITVAVVVTNNSESPVRILGIKTEAGVTDLSVVIRNDSSRLVRAVTVDVATVAPDGCSSVRHAPIFSTHSAGNDSLDSRLEIPPQSTAKLKAVGLHSEALKAGVFKSSYLQVQLGVRRVEFSDGTSWTRENTGLFDPKLLEQDALNCRDSATATQPLDSLETVTISPVPKVQSRDDAVLQGRHEFSCEVVAKTAHCGA
jgi:hypothetical protein